MKTALIGLGNPIVSDDAVGIRAVEALEKEPWEDVDVKIASVGGMELVEMMLDYPRAIVVDSILTGKNKVGTVIRITPEDFSESKNISNLHNVGFIQALKFWSSAGGSVPEDIVIYAMEVEDVSTFSETMTPGVESSLPELISRVRDELNCRNRSSSRLP